MEPYGENYLFSSLKKIVSKLFVLMSCCVVLFLCLVEEIEGEDGDGGKNFKNNKLT